MKNRLFIFGSFADNPQGILAAIGQFALVGSEGILKGLLGITLELRIATLTNTEHRRGVSYDSEIVLWHDLSLAHNWKRTELLWI
jgi:hypothetical protein